MNKTKQRIKELERNIKKIEKEADNKEIDLDEVESEIFDPVDYAIPLIEKRLENDYKLEATKQTLKEVEEVIDKLQDKASNEMKVSTNKKYWLGCCQILNELKKELGLEVKENE